MEKLVPLQLFKCSATKSIQFILLIMNWLIKSKMKINCS